MLLGKSEKKKVKKCISTFKVRLRVELVFSFVTISNWKMVELDFGGPRGARDGDEELPEDPRKNHHYYFLRYSNDGATTLIGGARAPLYQN